MTELIKINETEGKKTVSARELHQKLEATERFNSWMDRMLKYGFELNTDYTTVKVLTEVQNNGGIQKRELDEYFISIDMAKEICMIQKNEKGKKFRKYFIECEKQLQNFVVAIDPVKEKEIGLERARILREIAAEYIGNSKTWKQILDAHATKEIAGEFLLPLPEVTEYGETAEMIGKPYGLSCQKVGAIAKKLGITKTEENGFVRVNKAKNCNKEVETFYYNKNAISKIVDEIEKELKENDNKDKKVS